MSIYFYGCVTMDGYLADKNHGLNWLHETGTAEETNYNAFYSKMDITMMGKKTFDEIATMENVALFYPTTKNYVFTHSDDFSVAGFTRVNIEVIEFVKSISRDKNIWVIGGNTLLAPLLNENMIDEIVLQIAPVLLGAGIPLFTQNDDLKRFKLEKVNHHGQFAELIYRKKLEDDTLMRNPEQTIGNMIDKATLIQICYIDDEDFPITKAMLPPREREGIAVFWFSTNASSNKVRFFRENSKASIYFADKRFFRGVSLRGKIEVLETPEAKERIWRDGDTTFYHEGVTDPDYCVLKFTATKCRYYSNFKSVDFEII